MKIETDILNIKFEANHTFLDGGHKEYTKLEKEINVSECYSSSEALIDYFVLFMESYGFLKSSTIQFMEEYIEAEKE